jgi:hypothetical protein
MNTKPIPAHLINEATMRSNVFTAQISVTRDRWTGPAPVPGFYTLHYLVELLQSGDKSTVRELDNMARYKMCAKRASEDDPTTIAKVMFGDSDDDDLEGEIDLL